MKRLTFILLIFITYLPAQQMDRLFWNGSDWRRLEKLAEYDPCLLYTSPSPRDRQKSRMPSSA